jgi:NAD(P)-dependent dehydrogenase (short-subunit alcohol dehydrogenase family)
MSTGKTVGVAGVGPGIGAVLAGRFAAEGRQLNPWGETALDLRL